jgi:hypothetical protein
MQRLQQLGSVQAYRPSFRIKLDAMDECAHLAVGHMRTNVSTSCPIIRCAAKSQQTLAGCTPVTRKRARPGVGSQVASFAGAAWLTPKKAGQYTLLARAKDANGGVQPDKHDRNYGTYVINHPLPIEVFVAPKNGN